MNTQAIQNKLNEYYNSATPEQVVKEFEDMDVEFVKTEGPIEILTNYGAIPIDWRHCIQELEECYDLEEQKRKTALSMLSMFRMLICNQIDINWQQGLLNTIKEYEDELNKTTTENS